MSGWLHQRAVTQLPLARPADGTRRFAASGAVGIALLVLLVWTVARGRGAVNTATVGEPLRTARIERRDFARTLRFHGIVEAVDSYSVAAPRLAGQNINTLVITRLTPGGTPVKRGGLLVEFDRQDQIKAALDRQADYSGLVGQIKKKEAEHAAARARDDSELKQAENTLEAAKLDLRKNEILARIDAEKNQLNLEEAQARLEQVRATYELKRRATRAELRVLEIQRDRAANAMRHAQANAEKMAIRAPLDGTVVLNPIWKSGQMAEVLEGDEVRPGVPFLQVVNPAAMRVRARVNQADIAALRVGQTVRLYLDAFPEMSFTGTVERLSAIGNTSGLSAKVRTFTALFSIQGSDPKLTPDLSAAVDVELERRPNALLVPQDAVLRENGQTYVRVARGSTFERRAVKLGEASDTEVVVESGVEAGTVVLRGAAAGTSGS